MNRSYDVTLSVVSHGQSALVKNLLDSLDRHAPQSCEVIVTINIPECQEFELGDYKYPIRVIENAKPKGFGANHNAAFREASGKYFCVANPDIEILSNPFVTMVPLLEDQSKAIGVVAPMVLGGDDEVQDSFRKFPTPLRIFFRIFNKTQDYRVQDRLVFPEWVAGMFMLVRSDLFDRIHGFDERYFMYCEDADFCRRAQKIGYRVCVDSEASVVHHARRDSHRNLRYLRWHVASLWRFFLTSWLDH